MRYKNEWELARKAAKAAGDYLFHLGDRCVSSDVGRDIKLEADNASEEILLQILAKESSYPIISEESPGDGCAINGLHWIIDPLDGSYNYYKGMNELCCVSVALWDCESPVLGVVNRFSCGEIYEGFPGKGVFINNRQVSCSSVESVEHASVATGFSVKGDFSEKSLTLNIRIFSCFKKIRMLGTAALMTAYVGAGKLDAYFERDILLWDIGAGAAIILAGGGTFDCSLKDGYRCDVFCFANQALKTSFENYHFLEDTA